ncbi:MAG: MATE family efflux transporter [Thermoplasmata archaeon]|nr:MATE family efflux transporter [Thermoplasmata archaeon]
MSSRAERVTEEILHGDLVRALFLLGWPIMVNTLIQTLYNVADTFWVGHIPETSRQALAAINTSWPVVFLMISLGTGFGIAGVAFISQARGAGDRDLMLRILSQLYSLVIIFSASVSALGYFLTPYLLLPLGLEPQVRDLADTYLRIIFQGIPFMFLTQLFSSTLRGVGETFIPMVVNGTSVAVNAVLDPFLIFGWGPFPEMGILGAALATVVTRMAAAGVALFLILRGVSDLKLVPRLMIPELSLFARILKVGLPSSFSNSLMALGFYLLMFIIARVRDGTTALAAYGLGDRVIHLMFIAVDGIAFSLSTIIGQNIGAGQFDRAEEAFRTAIKITFVILGVEAVIMLAFARAIISFFTNSELVVDEGARFLRIFVLGIPFFGVWRNITSLYNGAGQTHVSLVLSAIRLWGFRLPLAYLLGLVLGLQSTGVWWGMALSNLLGALTAFVVLKYVDWRKRII